MEPANICCAFVHRQQIQLALYQQVDYRSIVDLAIEHAKRMVRKRNRSRLEGYRGLSICQLRKYLHASEHYHLTALKCLLAATFQRKFPEARASE